MKQIKDSAKTVKITEAWVRKQPFSDSQRYIFDSDLPGFLICIGKARKTYYAEKVVHGKGCRVKIGWSDHFTAEQARKEASLYLMKMSLGQNPNEAKRQAKSENERDSYTLRQLWADFKKDRAKRLKPGTLKDYDCYFQRDNVFKPWMNRSVTSIDFQQVWDLHRRLATDHKSYANGAVRVLGSVLSYAVKRGKIDDNPVVKMRGEWYREKPRKGCIPDHRLSAWFKALDEVRHLPDPPSAGVVCDLLEFLVLTGLRLNEGATLTWQQVDFEQQVVRIDDTKNGDPLTLPLTDRMLTIIESRQGKDDVWVFPSTAQHKGGSHVVDTRAIRDLVAARCGVEFINHDLRRTFNNAAMKIVSYGILKALMNHRAASHSDVTLNYFSPSVEDLREPLQKVTDYFMAKKAEGQGLKLATA